MIDRDTLTDDDIIKMKKKGDYEGILSGIKTGQICLISETSLREAYSAMAQNKAVVDTMYDILEGLTPAIQSIHPYKMAFVLGLMHRKFNGKSVPAIAATVGKDYMIGGVTVKAIDILVRSWRGVSELYEREGGDTFKEVLLRIATLMSDGNMDSVFKYSQFIHVLLQLFKGEEMPEGFNEWVGDDMKPLL